MAFMTFKEMFDKMDTVQAAEQKQKQKQEKKPKKVK